MGTYIDADDIDAVFGVANVTQWSDIEASGSRNTTQITNAIAEAEKKVEDEFRGGRYTVPLVAASSGGLDNIKTVIARLAGVILYKARGQADTGDSAGAESERMSDNMQSVMDEIRAYKAGTMSMDAQIDDQHGESPVAH